jgi:predicted patatin/cPLA2 family phospholipase
VNGITLLEEYMSSYSGFIKEYIQKFKTCTRFEPTSLVNHKKSLFLVHIYENSKEQERVFYTEEQSAQDALDFVIRLDHLWREHEYDSSSTVYMLSDKQEIKTFKEKTKIKPFSSKKK